MKSASPDIKYLSMNSWQKTSYKLTSHVRGLIMPFIAAPSVWKASSPQGKAVIALSPFCGLGRAVSGKLEHGLINMLLFALYFVYMALAGGKWMTGEIWLSYLNLQAISITATILAAYFYLKVTANTLSEAARMSEGEQYKPYIAAELKKLFMSLKASFENYGETFKFASPHIKASMLLPFVIMGSGQLLQRQFVKGIGFLAIQIIYIAYMAYQGAADLAGLASLEAHNVLSSFCILYGLLTLLITVAFAFAYLRSVDSALSNARMIDERKQPLNFKQEWHSLSGKRFYKIMLVVPVLGALAFTVLPLLFMILIAFTDYATSQTIPVINTKWLSWVGFDTFRSLFSSGANLEAFTGVFEWTILWAVLATFTCYMGGILLAVLLNNKKLKCKVLWRSIFILTMAIPQFVSLLVLNSMFKDYGAVNTLLIKWGLIDEYVRFWSDETTARALIILINMWIGIPYFMLLSTGLLINIPKDFYEYARTEGASKGYIFRKITLPHLMFMTTPLLITTFVSNINNFNVIWLLTGGGTSVIGKAGNTDILITWLYKLTMQNNPEYNLGAAIGIIIFIISAVLSLIVYRHSSSYKREEDFR